MAIQTSCPYCGKTYKLVDQQAGQKVRCKECREVFTAPTAAERGVKQPPANPSAAPAPRPAPRPARGDEFPAARPVKQSREQPPSRSLLVPLLICGGVLGAFFLVGVGGLATWLFLAKNPTISQGPQLASSPALQGQEAIKPVAAPAAQGVEELKAATVFVKVTAGPLSATGSGFVLKVDGNTGYVVTNEHVINPKAPPVGRGRRGGGVPRELPPAEVTLVFWSGTRQEQSFRAEVAAADPELDLAVLRVSGVASLPRPIDLGGTVRLTETLPVTVLGFPFGEMLGMREGNPSITVSKGSVSSIRRNQRDEVVAVQIDGALNPGNSGGPVVDPEGHLVGVAVATIRGANIGLAVPGGTLASMLNGRVSEVRATTKPSGEANVEVEVEVPLIDPLKRITSVTVHYLRSDLVKDKPQADKEDHWPEIAAAQRVALRVEGTRAVGTFEILSADKDKLFTFQVVYTNGAGRLVLTQPKSLPLRAPGQIVVTRPPIVGPGGRLPGQQPPVAQKTPDNRPPQPPLKKELVPLGGPVADVAVGGGGRYLILRLAGKSRLAVFDAQQAKVVKELPLSEEPAHVAAGANRLVLVYPNAKQIQLFSLATFERERSALLPGTLTADTIHQICMGSASAGPLFVYLPKEKRTLALDLNSLQTTEVRWKHWAPNNAYGPLNMRASADGTLLVGWGGGWAGLEVATFRDGVQTGSNDTTPYWAFNGAFALPSADGRFVYAPERIVSRDFTSAQVPELKGAYVVPAVEPGYFLALSGTCSHERPPPYAQAEGEAAVYTEDRKPLFFLRSLDELKTRMELAWEKRVHYYPRTGLLVTLGGGTEALVLRRVDLADQLEKSDTDYLVVLSRPPAAKAGADFSYKLDVRSKKGGVKVTLHSGPPGLKVTPEGQVSWPVPAKPDAAEANVLLTIRDASGQEVLHTFKVEVADR